MVNHAYKHDMEPGRHLFFAEWKSGAKGNSQSDYSSFRAIELGVCGYGRAGREDWSSFAGFASARL